MNNENSKMKPQEIRASIDESYSSIRREREKIEAVREMCGHEETHEGLCEWAVGHTYPATICTYCDKIVGGLLDVDPITITVSEKTYVYEDSEESPFSDVNPKE